MHKLDSCALPSIALKEKKEMNGKNCFERVLLRALFFHLTLQGKYAFLHSENTGLSNGGQQCFDLQCVAGTNTPMDTNSPSR